MAQILNFDQEADRNKEQLLEALDLLRKDIEEGKIESLLVSAFQTDNTYINSWAGPINPTSALGQLEFFKYSIMQLMDES